MTPQQYERLTELFHAAMELTPDERTSFLDQVGKGDADVRRELESLLAVHEQGAYTEKPPEDIAAGLFLAYQEFFALWKDADADLPVLIEAKKEYEKLK